MVPFIVPTFESITFKKRNIDSKNGQDIEAMWLNTVENSAVRPASIPPRKNDSVGHSLSSYIQLSHDLYKSSTILNFCMPCRQGSVNLHRGLPYK